MSIGNQFPPWQAPFGPTTPFTVFCSSVLCPRMALLLQSFRNVALSYVHGVYAHWQIDLILDRIRSFLGPTPSDDVAPVARTLSCGEQHRTRYYGENLVLSPFNTETFQIEPLSPSSWHWSVNGITKELG